MFYVCFLVVQKRCSIKQMLLHGEGETRGVVGEGVTPRLERCLLAGREEKGEERMRGRCKEGLARCSMFLCVFGLELEHV